MTADTPTRILEEISPSGSHMAIVEDDGRAVYLCLVRTTHDHGIADAVWVRNRQPAPMEGVFAPAESGEAPLMPFSACTYPAGMPAMDPESLELVWFAAGDAVALLENSQPIAVIPPWSRVGKCPGYSRDCTTQTPIAWPLGPAVGNTTQDRVAAAVDFWSRWGTGAPWDDFRNDAINRIEKALGAKHHQYYAIDGDRWPPRFLLRVDRQSDLILATGGLSIRPQPDVERRYSEPGRVRRIELAMSVPKDRESELPDLTRMMSSLASLPWHAGTFLDDRHTVPHRDRAALLRRDPPGMPTIDYGHVEGDPVGVIWVIPITREERELAVRDGSDALIDTLKAQGRTN
jgi:hypothetical protein